MHRGLRHAAAWDAAASAAATAAPSAAATAAAAAVPVAPTKVGRGASRRPTEQSSGVRAPTRSSTGRLRPRPTAQHGAHQAVGVVVVVGGGGALPPPGPPLPLVLAASASVGVVHSARAREAAEGEPPCAAASRSASNTCDCRRSHPAAAFGEVHTQHGEPPTCLSARPAYASARRATSAPAAAAARLWPMAHKRSWLSRRAATLSRNARSSLDKSAAPAAATAASIAAGISCDDTSLSRAAAPRTCRWIWMAAFAGRLAASEASRLCFASSMMDSLERTLRRTPPIDTFERELLAPGRKSMAVAGGART